MRCLRRHRHSTTRHESGWNKFLHGVGIPMIFAGIIFLLFTKMDLGSRIFSRRMGASLSRPPDRGKPSGVFSRTDLFASWANLGCKGSMDVPNGHAPQADLGRYSAKRRDEVNAAIPIVCAKSKNSEGRRQSV